MRIAWPSRATRSSGPTRCPSVAARPLTVMRPAAISASMSRREPCPARASALCSRSAGARGPLRGALLGLGGLAGLGGRRSGRLGLRELKGFSDLFERRQLLQRAQPEVVEELLGGREQGRA